MHLVLWKQQRGFNLVEIVAVLSVAMIALGAGLPLLSSLHAGLQQRTAINQWMATLASARVAAIERSSNVVACPSRGDTCAATSFWQDGWIVFEDGNRNAQRETGEPILLVAPAEAGVRILSNAGRTHVRYRLDGSSEGSNATITFCDRRGASKARTLVVNNAGRVRSGAASPTQAAAACGND
ncbi:MAG: GspH/FimT family pseudopilin [Rhodanobacteraceae bacterium]|nr:GspH/FimT family pseudopilin [Rhodanobacteraceae bacterium]